MEESLSIQERALKQAQEAWYEQCARGCPMLEQESFFVQRTADRLLRTYQKILDSLESEILEALEFLEQQSQHIPDTMFQQAVHQEFASRGKDFREHAFSQETLRYFKDEAFALWKHKEMLMAGKVYKMLCLYAPEILQHWLGMGLCFQQTQEMQEARMCFYYIIDHFPQEPIGYMHLYLLEMEEKSYSDAKNALAEFRRALEENPDPQMAALIPEFAQQCADAQRSC